MRRICAGEYASLDGRYRVVNNWADDYGWTLLRIADNGDAECLSEHRILRDAKEEVDRLERAEWLRGDA